MVSGGGRVLWLPMLDGTDRAGVLRIGLGPGVVDDGAAASAVLGAVGAARPHPDQQGALQRAAAVDPQRSVAVGVGGPDVAARTATHLRHRTARGDRAARTVGPGRRRRLRLFGQRRRRIFRGVRRGRTRPAGRPGHRARDHRDPARPPTGHHRPCCPRRTRRRPARRPARAGAVRHRRAGHPRHRHRRAALPAGRTPAAAAGPRRAVGQGTPAPAADTARRAGTAPGPGHRRARTARARRPAAAVLRRHRRGPQRARRVLRRAPAGRLHPTGRTRRDCPHPKHCAGSPPPSSPTRADNSRTTPPWSWSTGRPTRAGTCSPPSRDEPVSSCTARDRISMRVRLLRVGYPKPCRPPIRNGRAAVGTCHPRSTRRAEHVL